MALAPHPEEQRHSAQARAEGLAAAQRLPKGHLVELVSVLKGEADEHSKETRAMWGAWQDLWENLVDLGGKEDWQTQIWVGTPFAAVEQATAQISRALVDSPEFWGISGKDDRTRALADQLWKPLLTGVFEESHFANKFVDVCKRGFIMGVAGYLKFLVRQTLTPGALTATVDPATGQITEDVALRPRLYIAIETVDPCRVYRDPESRPRENFSGSYLFHSEWKGQGFLRAMVQGGWDAEAVARTLQTASGRAGGATATGATDADQHAAMKLMRTKNKFRKIFLVDEGWLDVLDENGDVVFTDAFMIRCADEILHGPAGNPFWATDLATGRRKWPFVATTPIVHLDRFEGRGILEQDADLSWLMNQILMLSADGLNWLINPETEVFINGLEDYDDMGHYPGRLWKKNVPQQVLMQAQNGRIDLAAVLHMLGYLNQQRENTNFVTQFVQGLPGTRSDITKGEVQIKTAQSLASFESMGRNLELGGREAVELTHQLATQFLLANPMDPSVVAVVGPQMAWVLAQMPMGERMELCQGNYHYSFTGVSQALQKQDLIQRLTQFGALAASQPYVQLLMQTGQLPVFLQILKAVRNTFGLGDQIEIRDDAMPMMGPPGAPPVGPGGMAAPEQIVDQLIRDAMAGAGGPGGGPEGYASQPAAAGLPEP